MSKRIILPIVAVSALLTAGVSMAAGYSLTIYNGEGNPAGGTLANQPVSIIVYGTKAKSDSSLPSSSAAILPQAAPTASGITGVPCAYFGPAWNGNGDGVGSSYQLNASSTPKLGDNPFMFHIDSNNCATVTGVQLIPQHPKAGVVEYFADTAYGPLAASGLYTYTNTMGTFI